MTIRRRCEERSHIGRHPWRTDLSGDPIQDINILTENHEDDLGFRGVNRVEALEPIDGPHLGRQLSFGLSEQLRIDGLFEPQVIHDAGHAKILSHAGTRTLGIGTFRVVPYRQCVSFFAPLPVDVGRLVSADAEHDESGPPRHVLGVAIAPALVASTAEAALVVEGGVVYPAGVLVRVGARLRRAISQTDNYIAPQFHWHWPPHPPDAGFIDVGVRFVDGTELRNSDNTLLSLSGAGSALSAWHDLWAPGAPLDGTVELWTRWIGAGIAETRTRLELTAARTGPTPIW